MLGKYAGWIVVGLMFASTFTVAQQRSVHDEPSLILALETAWNHAEETKNVAALDQLLHPTPVYVDYDGTLMNKAEFLASVKAPDLHPRPDHQRYRHRQRLRRCSGGDWHLP